MRRRESRIEIVKLTRASPRRLGPAGRHPQVRRVQHVTVFKRNLIGDRCSLSRFTVGSSFRSSSRRVVRDEKARHGPDVPRVPQLFERLAGSRLSLSFRRRRVVQRNLRQAQRGRGFGRMYVLGARVVQKRAHGELHALVSGRRAVEAPALGPDHRVDLAVAHQLAEARIRHARRAGGVSRPRAQRRPVAHGTAAQRRVPAPQGHGDDIVAIRLRGFSLRPRSTVFGRAERSAARVRLTAPLARRVAARRRRRVRRRDRAARRAVHCYRALEKVRGCRGWQISFVAFAKTLARRFIRVCSFSRLLVHRFGTAETRGKAVTKKGFRGNMDITRVRV